MLYSIQAITLLGLAVTASTTVAKVSPRATAPTCIPICPVGSTFCTQNHARQPKAFGTAIKMPVAPGPNEGFVVLTSTGVSNVPQISINGNVGVAPAAISYITSMALVDHGNYASSYEVNSNGKVYGADTSGSQTPLAVQHMITSYNDAAQLTADYSNCQSGKLDGLVLGPGVYHWSNAVSLSDMATVTIKGGPHDHFIFQSSTSFAFGANSKVILSGISPDQVFWVASTTLTVGNTAQFRGTALTYQNIVVADNAQVTGRLWTQTQASFAKGSIVYAPTYKAGIPDSTTPGGGPTYRSTTI